METGSAARNRVQLPGLSGCRVSGLYDGRTPGIKYTLMFRLKAALCCFFLCTGSTLFSQEAYWLWAGVPLARVPSGKPVLYVHQGAIVAGHHFVPEGIAPFPIASGPLFLVFRLNTIDDKNALLPAFLDLAARWEKHGARVEGIQLDFDAVTARLGSYRDTLACFRKRLPPRYRLSVTGLADWATTGEPRELRALAGVTQEIVFQLYRGKQPIPHLADYARKLGKIDFPFRIGTLESMSVPSVVSKNPFYRGNVVFLLKTGDAT